MAKQLTEKRKTLTLDPETHRKLRIYAAKTGMQMMMIMKDALAEFMKKKNNIETVDE